MQASRALLTVSGLRVMSAALVLLVHPPLTAADDTVDGIFMATAYSVQGITASGLHTHRHIVAADPSILPIGSRVKIRHAGRYSGEYVVADTGMKIEGRKLDLYLASTRACRKFGSRPVQVRVIQLGDGTHAAAKEADHAVKADVAKDLQKNAVGNAATEDDWKTKPRAGNAAAGKAGSNTASSTSTTNGTGPK